MSQASKTKFIMRELSQLQKNPNHIDGISILPLEEDITSGLKAVVFGPEGTPYAGGQFLVQLVLGDDYPSAPPKGFFVTKIFHPNVNKAGDICVNTLKKDWNEKLGLAHVLTVIKCLLIVPNPASALNEEAGKLLLENYDEFASKARLMTKVHAMKQLVTLETSENDDEENAVKKSKAVDKSAGPVIKKAKKKKKKMTLKRL